jgi:hypothetical protein
MRDIITSIEKDSKDLQRENFRKKVTALEQEILKIPGTIIGNQPDCPLKHSFGYGLYVREIFMPAGKLVISKIHKRDHPYFILKGKVTIVTEDGPMLVIAPFYSMTKAGTKRALYVHEDCIWVTVHKTDETDIDKIEDEIIAKSFDDVPPKEGI